MSRSVCSAGVAFLLTAGLMAIFGCAEDKTPPSSKETTAAANLNKRTGHERMVAVLEDLAVRSANENMYQGDGRAMQLRAAIKDLPANAPMGERVRLLRLSGTAELRASNETESIRILTDP